MSYMAHNAIIVTSQIPEKLVPVRDHAVNLGLSCSEIIKSNINNVGTFLIAPDGSKEDWVDSDEGDKRRDEFTTWLRTQILCDGSSLFEWCEVRYGSDDRETKIVQHQWQKPGDPE